jgi:hypothetical protein
MADGIAVVAAVRELPDVALDALQVASAPAI